MEPSHADDQVGRRDRGRAALARELSSSVTPRPRSAARNDECFAFALGWQVSWLAVRRPAADLPGFPVVIEWQSDSPLTVAGAAAASNVAVLTAFPFDPRREPSSTSLCGDSPSGKGAVSRRSVVDPRARPRNARRLASRRPRLRLVTNCIPYLFPKYILKISTTINADR